MNGLKKNPLPSCCSAYFLNGMDVSRYIGGGGTIKDMEKNLKEKLKMGLGNQTSIFLITSKAQKETMRLLRQMGWECSPWLERHGVSKTSTYNKIKMWWFRLTPERVKKACALDYQRKEKIFPDYEFYSLYIRKKAALSTLKRIKEYNKQHPENPQPIPEFDKKTWVRKVNKRYF